MKTNAFRKRLTISVLLVSLSLASVAQSNKPNGSTRPSKTAVSVPATVASGTKINYIRTREALAPISDASTFDAAAYTHVKQTTQYLDGLGRPLQTVQKQVTPAAKDLVAPIVYDAYGRETYKYLPYASSENNGNFKRAAFSDQATFMAAQFSGESIFYSQTLFEASPLERVSKSMSPGNSWADTAAGIRLHYLVNNADDAVRIWDIANDTLTYSGGDAGINLPLQGGTYASGQLSELHTIDENGKEVVEYKDKDGKIVLKKVQVSATPSHAHDGWLCTYYVYDDFGLLRFVISPKATEYLAANSWTFTGTVADELCFRYQYDKRNRMIAKKVPGAAWVYIVYDKRDRMVFTQDGNMRSNNNWMGNIYDEQNRLISTGMISYAYNRGALQWVMDAVFTGTDDVAPVPGILSINARVTGITEYKAQTKIEFTDGFTTEDGATMQTILTGPGSLPSGSTAVPPGITFIPLTVNQYDDYRDIPQAYSTANNSNIDDGGNSFAESLPSAASLRTRGMITQTQVRVIVNPTDLTAGDWITTANFYDEKGRTVQTTTENYKKGIDVNTILYDFSGKVLTTYAVHNNPAASQTVKAKTNLLYDHAGRLLQTTKTLNDNSATTRYLNRNTYDELGQLTNKKLGQRGSGNTDAMEEQDHTYNIRGWLKGINSAYAGGSGDRWFGMELNYDYGCDHNELNGNIAGNRWRSKGDGEQRAFGYGYDAANRLLFADFKQYTGGWNNTAGINYSVLMGDGIDHASAYDANGNIKVMKQSAWKIGGSALIDNLSYTYTANTNKLLNVIDANNDTATHLGDFRSSKAYMTLLSNTRNVSDDDYTYDVNGNLVRDRNKDISAITYNHLNLPSTITVTGKGSISYVYDAAGNKLEKQTTEGSAVTKTTYLGGYVYNNDNLQFLAHEEGRVRKKADNSYVYDYFVKDHLGNTRAVLTEELDRNTYPVATLENGATGVEGEYYYINTGKIVDASTATGFSSASGHDYANNNGNPPYNNNPASVVAATSTKLYKLNGNSGDKTGLGITVKVMTGDTVSIFGKSYWHSNGTAPTNSYSIVVNDLLTALAGTGVVGAANKGATSGGLTGSSVIPGDVTSWLTNAPSAGSGPKAYINWILFDEQFRVVSGSSGFHKVGSADVIDSYSGSVDITKNGYLYVYCSNESNTDVFFDNLQLIHSKGPLMEETHYYPFGLTMAGISSKAAGKLENRYKYNGIELDEDLGIDTYEAKFRMLNQQIGRWWQIDPKVDDGYESLSPYASMYNDPIKISDPLGDEGGILGWVRTAVSNTRDFVAGVAAAVVDNNTFGLNNQRQAVGRDVVNAGIYNAGQSVGDALSVVQGVVETIGGAIAAGGGTLAAPFTGGASLDVTALGVGAIVHGTAVIANGAKNLVNQNGRVSAEGSPSGSYTNTHESGKKYHGKGTEKRANQSAKEKAKKFNDPVKEVEHKPAKNSREGFKDEAKRIQNDGGVENPNNYNKINSPGKKDLPKN